MRAAVAVMALVLAACDTPLPAGVPPTPWTRVGLVPTDQIQGDFALRQHIGFHYGDERGSFEAIIQMRCDTLEIVGLTPFGTRAFRIRQRGIEVEAEIETSGPWPFPPRYVLLDVHRVHFLPIAAQPPPDGVHETIRAGEILRDRWQGGRLRERAIAAASAEPMHWTLVTYPGGATHAARPARARLHNTGFGYRLDITTVSRQEIETSCPTP